MNYPRKVEINLDTKEIALTTIKHPGDYEKRVENIRVKFSEADIVFISGGIEHSIFPDDAVKSLFHTDKNE